MYIYYPSCNFIKNFGSTAVKLRKYLDEQPDVRIAGCCQSDTAVPGNKDVIVTVCNSCMRQLEEVFPQNSIISLYEFMLTRKDFKWPDYEGKTVVLQDCFRAIGKHGMHEAVRECLNRMHIKFKELERSRDNAEFDGSFLLHDPYPRNIIRAPKYFRDYLPEHIIKLPENEWEGYFKDYVSVYNEKPAVCYCNTCCLGVKAGGGVVYHLAELMTEDAKCAE